MGKGGHGVHRAEVSRNGLKSGQKGLGYIMELPVGECAEVFKCVGCPEISSAPLGRSGSVFAEVTKIGVDLPLSLILNYIIT